MLAARWQFFEQVLRSRIDTSANGTSTHFDVYGFIPDVLSSHPLFGLGLNNFSVYYEFVTGRTNFGPHSFYVATIVETGLVGTALFVAFLVYLFKRLGRLRAIGAHARLAADPAARVGDDRRARRHDRRERLLPDDVLLLLLRLRAPRARGADRVRPPADVKVVVLTTSYPRGERDVAGLFVRDAVEAVRAQGVEVEVVSPASFRHFGIAYGHGIVGNLRRRPWLALLLPAFLVAFARAARRAARDADLVHAHWLPSGARGADDRQAVRRPGLGHGRRARPARAVALPAAAAPRAARDRRLASPWPSAARELGAREVRVVPSGVEIPESVGEPDEPPHVLFVGRLSPEKGILEFLAATAGLPRVIVGDGPVDGAGGGRLRAALPSSARTTSARRSCASRRAARATASSRARRWRTAGRSWRRPSAALVDVDRRPRPAGRRRTRCARRSSELLADAGWRAHLGAQARETAREQLAPEVAARALAAVYEEAVS